MNFRLVVVQGPDKGKIFPLFQENSTLLGRSRHANSKLNDMRISRVHCEVDLRGTKVTAIDLESGGGTYVNGKKISEQVLQVGDQLQIGDTVLKLEGPTIHEQKTLPPPARPTALPRTRLGELVGKKFSHYELCSVITQAQSGQIFKATDFKNDRPAALKVMWPEFSKNEEEMSRFVRAMKTMMPHQHANLVRLYGAGKSGPYCWIAMEYVEGEGLHQVMERIGAAGMLDYRYAVRVAVHVARALEYAHEKSIIHRNITPTNIIVRRQDKVAKLGDLMLAKAQEGSLAQQITKPGEIIGDVIYMSPERTGAGAVDARSDIYSLGATIYTLVTGKPPCAGNSIIDTIQKIRTQEPVKPKKFQLGIPDFFDTLIMKMLEKRPEARFPNATALLKDLEKVAKYQGIAL